MKVLWTLILAASVTVSQADIYMHNLAGSNNRNRERNENRNNNNRLFDSQNNGKGGYPWRGDRTLINQPDPLTVYEGSMLQMEWTLQHSCGANPNAHCSVVFQYACQDTLPNLRDGYPSGKLVPVPNNPDNDFEQASFVTAKNADGTERIPDTVEAEANTEYGLHENLDYYRQCQSRQRNSGLYTADQKLGGQGAIFTRQNPNGQRSGLECPEERDYYPYWHPSPWRDVAILTSNETFCPYYTSKSQNVASTSYCAMTDEKKQNAPNKVRPITAALCTQFGGVWTEVPSFNTDAPTCELHQFSRDNHLGNVGQKAADGSPSAANYKWKIPYVSQMFTRGNYPFDATVPSAAAIPPKPMSGDGNGLLCIARLRYNISTNDYPSMKGMDGSSDKFFDSSFNCGQVTVNDDKDGDVDKVESTLAEQTTCDNKLRENRRPRHNRPYVQMFTDKTTPLLSIAMNTNQLGRTFQDRSYVFKIVPRPSSVPANAVIWNLNNRGRRGNIVQAYPAVEYDFVPQVLNTHRDDYIHVQFHGSDYNQAQNPNNAEGWRFSDRFNMVQTEEANTQIPLSSRESTLFQDEDEAKKYALLDQDKKPADKTTGQPYCKPFVAGTTNEQNSPFNCGKLNAAPAHMDFGLKPMTTISRGTYYYLSTRNNNFSNRSQKGVLIVSGLSVGETVGVALGVAAFVGISAAGALFAVRRGFIKVPKRFGGSDTARI